MIDIIGQIFWYGIFATPIISFLILRNIGPAPIVVKIILGIFLTLALGSLFYIIAMTIVFRDGMGPS